MLLLKLKINKTETKFTKGEWEMKGVFKDQVWYNDAKIADCSNDTQSSIYIEKQEMKYNAKLIAAAPDLLEACIDDLRILELHPTYDNLYRRNKLKELIKKATE